ncbi:hypothetical protein FB566_4476 [Stackebrandtia endophytica]|uniref:Magnesium transporter NIPA n=1 Tax=Stackebrandtia endophytica TaxID=1496996 RepID=A0A543B221_9ACTN|nr:hypothetical protein [Stackebrandtia endophytica]TQL78879.1 hypothetical protein FB566_4476 [Stackebrandtia endophytica]
MTAGWFFLAAMIMAYGVANFLQAVAASRESKHETFNPRLLLKLASQKTYLAGIGCQVFGFLLAIVARADLPLFLVQAAVAAGLGVTAVLGVLILKWQLPRAEIALLVGLTLGIAALVISAKPSASKDLDLLAILTLAGSWIVIAVLGWFTARRVHGVPGSVALGALAGLAFGAAAVASRPLASAIGVTDLVSNPLLYLIIVQSLTGQLLLALAMQRGSTTAAVAAMDAAFAAPAAAVGLLLLGDQIRPGLEWLAAAGFLVTLATVLALTRFAEPQADKLPPRLAPVTADELPSTVPPGTAPEGSAAEDSVPEDSAPEVSVPSGSVPPRQSDTDPFGTALPISASTDAGEDEATTGTNRLPHPIPPISAGKSPGQPKSLPRSHHSQTPLLARRET